MKPIAESRYANICLTRERGVEKITDEEFNELYSSPNIIRMIKSIKMRRAGHVTRMRRRVVHRGFGWGNLRERDRLEDPGIDGRMLGPIFRTLVVGAWTGLIWLRIVTGSGQL
jgi:hypothetical protein